MCVLFCIFSVILSTCGDKNTLLTYLKVASLVRSKGLSERNHHFFHVALVAMGLNVRALVRAQLNVGDQQIRDDGLHWLHGWSRRGKMGVKYLALNRLTRLAVSKERMPLCLRQESHWEPGCGTAESGQQVVGPPERKERKRKLSLPWLLFSIFACFFNEDTSLFKCNFKQINSAKLSLRAVL